MAFRDIYMRIRSFVGRVLRGFKQRISTFHTGGPRHSLFVVLHPPGTDPRDLTELLESHRGMRYRHDVAALFAQFGFAPATTGGQARATALKSAAPAVLLYKHIFDAEGLSAVGMALDYDTLLSSLNAPVRSVLMWDGDVRILRYVPANYLRSYVSVQRRLQPSPGPVAVDPQAFLAYARQLDRMNEYVERAFRGHRQLKIEDDKLRGDARKGTSRQIASFLAVGHFPEASSYGRQAESPLRHLVSNLDAVENILRGTPYLRMLES